MHPEDEPGNSHRISRRTVLGWTGAAALGAAAKMVIGDTPLFAATDPTVSTGLGQWLDDEFGLPCYRYSGPLTFTAKMKNGEVAKQLPDPIFLIGNYKLTLFTHASGRYQLLTSERAWGRMNSGDDGRSGVNDASIEIAGTQHELVGIDSQQAKAAAKLFGVGYARYDYQVTPAISVTRLLSTIPSTEPNEGASAFIVKVQVRNTGITPVELIYREDVRANYGQILANWDTGRNSVRYTHRAVEDGPRNILRADATAHAPHLLAFGHNGGMSRLEGTPPSLFIKTLQSDSPLQLSSKQDDGAHLRLGVQASLTLASGSSRVLNFVVGYSREATSKSIDTLVAQVTGRGYDHKTIVPSQNSSQSGSPFGAHWQKVIAPFKDEPNSQLRREMRWNTAVLEQMAIYREYYDETVVSQGTDYDYVWGLVAGTRDLSQHALPVCHTNPVLARSVLRFLMKRTLPDGEVKLTDEGFGWAAHGAMFPSDSQLYFLMLFAEYLRVTRDATVLTEEVNYYPLERSAKGTGLDRIRETFLFLRDRIGVGSHGLVRQWNSDWNDMFYHWPTTTPYNSLFASAESLLNTAMAVAVLGDLTGVLDSLAFHLNSAAQKDASEVAAAMRQYRTQLLDAFLKDWGTRPFPRRSYFDKGAVGDDNMWLEPQGFALQIPEIPIERKQSLFGEIQRRLLATEVMGPRQVEKPFSQPGTEAGSRENGGFWYALDGPLVLGLATFDRKSAKDLLERMMFSNFAKHYPEYWAGQWSACDSLDSSLLPSEGLAELMSYCAHSHAWPLYCYLRLNEENET